MAEADGFVEVCAVLQGQLARDVNGGLRTEGDTASEFITMYIIIRLLILSVTKHVLFSFLNLCLLL